MSRSIAHTIPDLALRAARARIQLARTTLHSKAMEGKRCAGAPVLRKNTALHAVPVGSRYLLTTSTFKGTATKKPI